MFSYVHGLFAIATLCIAIFIAVYAHLFLVKTQQQRERRPWEYLFVASILYLIFEFLSLLITFGAINLVGVDIIMVSKLFEFLYSGFVLLAFVSQHDLILHSHLILISKKEVGDEVEITVEAKGGAKKIRKLT